MYSISLQTLITQKYLKIHTLANDHVHRRNVAPYTQPPSQKDIILENHAVLTLTSKECPHIQYIPFHVLQPKTVSDLSFFEFEYFIIWIT